MIEYKKLLHYFMLLKSAMDSTDNELSALCWRRWYGLLNDHYLNDEEFEFASCKELEYNVMQRKGDALREIIDDIFKIMGIYKEPNYVVE